MTTLITGGTSKIGLALAKRLKDAGRSVVIAGRSPEKVPSGYDFVLLDWDKPSTFGNAFADPSRPIENVHLLGPIAVLEPLAIVKPFIDLAIEKGVKFFVFTTATGIEINDFSTGRTQQYLADSGADYYIIRPSWFIENVFDVFDASIRQQGAIITCAPKGRIPLVSIEDIAQVSFDAIMKRPQEKEVYIVGPELLTYDELAAILTDYVGKPIAHLAISAEAKVAAYVAFGISEAYSKWLIDLEVKADEGLDERLAKDPKTYVGTVRVVDVLEKGRDFWAT